MRYLICVLVALVVGALASVASACNPVQAVSVFAQPVAFVSAPANQCDPNLQAQYGAQQFMQPTFAYAAPAAYVPSFAAVNVVAVNQQACVSARVRAPRRSVSVQKTVIRTRSR